jgi:hypothetical protein
MTKSILIHEDLDHIEEVEVDISPSKNEIFKILKGRQTFIGQWEDLDVVIMKAEDGKVMNMNTLPPPFDDEKVMGKILLLRMDEHSEPQDFSLEEYNSFLLRNECVVV